MKLILSFLQKISKIEFKSTGSIFLIISSFFNKAESFYTSKIWFVFSFCYFVLRFLQNQANKENSVPPNLKDKKNNVKKAAKKNIKKS